MPSQALDAVGVRRVVEWIPTPEQAAAQTSLGDEMERLMMLVAAQR